MKKYIVKKSIIIKAESAEMARQYFKEIISESSNEEFDVEIIE